MTDMPEVGSWNLFYQFIPGGMFQYLNDSSFMILWMSDVFCEMIGYTRNEIDEKYGNSFLEIISPKDRQDVIRTMEKQRDNEDVLELECRIMRGDGVTMWVLIKKRYYKTPDGKETFICFLMDITERKKMEEELRLNLERYQVIMDQTTNIIFEWDMVKDNMFFSGNWEKKFGYKAISEDLSSKLPFSQRIHPEDLHLLIELVAHMQEGKNYEETEFRVINIMSEYTWCRIRSTAQYNEEGKPIKAIGVILDIEEDKRKQQELLEAAYQDALTGLLNKAESRRRTENYLNAGHEKGSLVLMDLDDFKRINDRYGHLCGDAVLSDTAAVLCRLFPGDIIGRIGGDEFLLFIPEMGKAAAGEKAKNISVLLKEKKLPDSEDVICSSVGIAEWPEDADSFFELYRKADMALYYSKRNNKGKVTLYSEECSRKQENDNVDIFRSGSVIESEEMTDVERQLVSYTFHMLYQSQNIKVAVNQLLEIVGRSYDVSRVYIFESTLDGKHCSNTFEWCNEGVIPQIDVLQNISYDIDINGYENNFDENGIFYCEDISKLNKALYDILEPQGIKSMLQCAIIDDQEFKGYVGFDECRQNRYWTGEQTKSLGLIANILSEFLLKYRLKERMRELAVK